MVNIFSSSPLKLDVLHSSRLESFTLVVAIACHGNACPSLGCPSHTGSNKISYNLLVPQSAMPQLLGLHICSTVGLRNIYFAANLECWRRFLSCGLHEEEALMGACIHHAVKLPSNYLRRIDNESPLISSMLKLKIFHQPTDVAVYKLIIHRKVPCSVHLPLPVK